MQSSMILLRPKTVTNPFLDFRYEAFDSHNLVPENVIITYTGSFMYIALLPLRFCAHVLMSEVKSSTQLSIPL